MVCSVTDLEFIIVCLIAVICIVIMVVGVLRPACDLSKPKKKLGELLKEDIIVFHYKNKLIEITLTKQKEKENKMTTPFYYYIRDNKHNPVATVAVVFNDDGTVNRGVSWCSKQDIFNRNTGRKMALYRLELATKKEHNILPIQLYLGYGDATFPDTDLDSRYFERQPTDKEVAEDAAEHVRPIRYKHIQRPLCMGMRGYWHAPMSTFEYRMSHKPTDA